MKNFERVSFHGIFRNYQQTVLDNIEYHLKDKKIHIVAAPGSGKTILGLEIIRRLNEPAIIFSPSITIRQQWGDRFKEKFITSEEDLNEYVSFQLHELNLITSTTYQSLHAAFNKLVDKVEDDELIEEVNEIDYRKFDLIRAVKQAKVKTICLDEAHHLRSEWQKALEEFIHLLGEDITVISLTATPPYDSTPHEWKRYESLCGEIDEEIFVPELVAQNTLCPHQDYIYFNYPTISETTILKEYKEKSLTTINDIIQGHVFNGIVNTIFKNFSKQEDLILENTKDYIAILCLAKYEGMEIPKKLLNLVSPSGKLPRFSLESAEMALQFIVDHPNIFTIDSSREIKHILSSRGLIEKKKVTFNLNEKLNRMLLSSMGKLDSIGEIALSEYKSLGKDLRMLVLTDYIKKDMVKLIGTEEMPNVMGTVSVFESIRRRIGEHVSIGILSGSLIIVPVEVISFIQELSVEKGMHFSTKDIPNTKYCEILFRSNNKDKVAIITKIFEQGLINILVGTKSLLGEGWDSPCINNLILASFVGSYMLSNQMRGRAIRIDKNNPNKTANIWHLATIEPQYTFTNAISEKLFKDVINDKNRIVSIDYDNLIRRFNCFLAPAYIRESIESGIERIEIIKPPYDQHGFETINQSMLQLANDREGMKLKWNNILNKSSDRDIMETTDISTNLWPKKFVFVNLFYETILSFVLIYLIRTFSNIPLLADSFLSLIIYLAITVVIIYYMIIVFYKILKYISPTNTIKTLSNCILYTLKEMGEIRSRDARVIVNADSFGTYIQCSLDQATIHEKNVFIKALTELLSPIDNPRYLLIKKSFYNQDYKNSYACPSIIGTNKENAEILKRHVEKTAGNFELIYTRNELGRKLILKCRRWSYITANDHLISKRKRLKSK